MKKEKWIRTKNRIWSVCLILLGIISARTTGDATFLIFSLIWGIPVFFSREECIK